MTTITKTPISQVPAPVLSRILEEGYGAGAWHGPDLETALVDVNAELAFQRPGPGRHNIAEIALHHAWVLRSVVGQLTGKALGDFLMEGEDWFELNGKKAPTWAQVREALAANQQAMSTAIRDLGEGRIDSARSESERFDLVLGVTCHAVYHAGQIQLIKRLLAP